MRSVLKRPHSRSPFGDGRFHFGDGNGNDLRSLAAVTFDIRGHCVKGLVEIRHLRLLRLVRNGACVNAEKRLSAYRCHRIPWGVRCGGESGHLFEIDLRLTPRRRTRGARTDLNDRRLIQIALRLKQLLRQIDSGGSANVSPSIRFPRFWAAFDPCVAKAIQGDGPELCGASHTTGESAATLMERSRRSHRGLVLYPLDWVSHCVEDAAELFADMSRCPRYQIISLTSADSPLRGFRGAFEFDLTANRFVRS